MPEYICNCCAFQSKDKTLYKKHLETLKHKRLSNTMEGQEQALMNEITILKEEIKTLKLKLEVYKDVIKMQGLKKAESESEDEDELYDFNPKEYLESIDVDVSDENLIEEIAGLRTNDTEVTVDNAFDAFFHNERNHLPLIKDYLKMLEDPMHLGDLIIEKVLDNCSFKITNKYRKSYKLYQGEWLKPVKSAELLEQLIMDVYVNINCYNKLWQYYYGYDSKLRKMDKSKWADLEPKIKENRKIYKLDTQKIVEYILKKMSD